MIDINELRRLAQAATPGVGHACKYQDAHWLREGHVDFENADLFIASERPQEDAEFYAAANPAVINELLDRLEAAEKDIALKERIIDSLWSELNAVAKERDDLRSKNHQYEMRLRKILEAPEDTMSNSKALAEIIRQARLALRMKK